MTAPKALILTAPKLCYHGQCSMNIHEHPASPLHAQRSLSRVRTSGSRTRSTTAARRPRSGTQQPSRPARVSLLATTSLPLSHSSCPYLSPSSSFLPPPPFSPVLLSPSSSSLRASGGRRSPRPGQGPEERQQGQEEGRQEAVLGAGGAA